MQNVLKLPTWFVKAGHKLPREFEMTVYKHGYKKRVGRSIRHIAGRVPPADARRIYHERMPALLAGEVAPPAPPPAGDMNLEGLARRYLAARLADAKRADGDPAKILWTTYSSLRRDIGRLIRGLGRGRMVEGLQPDHFTHYLARASADPTMSPDKIRRVAKSGVAMFKYATGERWTPHVEVGKRFSSTASTNPRRERRDLFTLEEVRRIIAVARADALEAAVARADQRGGQRNPWPPRNLYAMILLALNGGYGQTDLARLPRAQVDLVRMVIDRPRTKTDVERLVPLWPETAAALELVMRRWPDDELVFRTNRKHPYVRQRPKMQGGAGAKVTSIDSISLAFGKLVRRLELRGKGRGFYVLRHIHRTISEEARDPHAAMRIVGHALPGMNDVYVNALSIDRLRRVAEHVRGKVLGGLAV